VPTSNADPPESRNRDVLKENGSAKKTRGSGNKRPGKRKLLVKSKDDILVQPRKMDESKATAKELERTKKWRDMAVIERPNGSIHYSFPITKKVCARMVHL
jgi:hypothetical protein